MKERPILFKPEMVRAILSGQKTQTRRIAIPKRSIEPMTDECPKGQAGDRLWVREAFVLEQQVEHDQKPPHDDGRPIKIQDGYMMDEWVQPHYRATDKAPELVYEDMPEDADHMCRWKPSIHMPRWASRINLEITDIRVERLHRISVADAIAEGTGVHPDHHSKPRTSIYSPVQAYRDLWEAINGAGSWDLNPWVWVIEFKRVAQ